MLIKRPRRGTSRPGFPIAGLLAVLVAMGAILFKASRQHTTTPTPVGIASGNTAGPTEITAIDSTPRSHDAGLPER